MRELTDDDLLRVFWGGVASGIGTSLFARGVNFPAAADAGRNNALAGYADPAQNEVALDLIRAILDRRRFEDVALRMVPRG